LKQQHRPQKALNRVVLPLDGRDDGMAADSVFSPLRPGDISIIGEIFRKMTHLGAISIPIIYYFLDKKVIIVLLTLGLITSLLLDYVRIFGNEKSRKFVYRYLGIMIRTKESKDFIGSTYILLGSIITILLFDKMVAMAGIAFIVVGDTAGAIIGRLCGRVRFRNKSLEGSISFFLACCLISIFIPGIPYWIKIAGAFTATIVEALTFHIDDNLIVPVTSAAIMQVLLSQLFIIGYFS
jgi:dolichol kinase